MGTHINSRHLLFALVFANRRPKGHLAERGQIEETCGEALACGVRTETEDSMIIVIGNTHVYPQYFFGVPTEVPTVKEISRFYERNDARNLLISWLLR